MGHSSLRGAQATKQSSLLRQLDCFASLAMTINIDFIYF